MRSVDIYFDYASPFAYLASEVLPAFAAKTGVSFRWKPIDQSKLSNYANGLPYSPLKRRYVVTDAVRSAEFHDVLIRIPKPHPVDSSAALLLAVGSLEESRFLALHRSIFRAAWREQRDLSRTEVLADCVTEANGDVDEWLARAELPETARRLEMLTAEAEDAGVFGVPSMLLEGELFWGLDSLPTLEWRLENPRAGS